MKRSHGEEGVEGKCRKDKGHDLWYRPGSLAEFRRIRAYPGSEFVVANTLTK